MSVITSRTLDVELVVAGGGMSGVCCALAAARLGARVALVQDRPVLGGNASSEIRMHIVGATGLRGGEPLVTELREGGLIEEIRLDLTVHNPQRSAAMMDLLLYDKCRREPNITLLLNTTVDGAEVEGGRVRAITATRASTEDCFRITGRIFVDATGDGRLGAEAGATWRQGREARGEFNEVLGAATADGRTLGSTLLFQARKHDRPMPYVAPPWVRRFKPEDFRLRPFGRPGFDLGLEYGYWWVEWGGCLDTLKDNEVIRDELLSIVLGVWNHIKNESGLDVAPWALDWFGFVPGKRESRRFIGRHVLTEADVFQARPFSDAIAYGGWPIDTHPPEGVDAPERPPCDQHHLPYLYDIPLRSCLSAEHANLLFAGRNLSATHLAFASTRVMATCAAVGQGVGTAAALALQAGLDPAQVPENPSLMRAVQQRLLRDDAHLVGVVNDDPDDRVRSASVFTASSAQPGAEPASVGRGPTRSTHGRPLAGTPRLSADPATATAGVAHVTCAPPDRARPGLHRWMSDPAAGLPAWLEIRWDYPVTLASLQLVFDTGLHRILTLSQADGYTAGMHWGRPQPETVRAYVMACEVDGAWREVGSVTDNYQRRRVHELPEALRTRAVRITVTATHGIDHARIVEVRAYGP